MTKEELKQEAREEFGKQFDELGMKPPKGSMPGLEREIIKDYISKVIDRAFTAGEEGERGRNILKGIEFLNNYPLKGFSDYDELYEKFRKALTPPNQE